MSLRVKVILFVILINAVSLVVMQTFAFRYNLKSFMSLEESLAERNLHLVGRNIEEYITNLDKMVRDYAYWDDTYGFMQNLNQAYIDSNIIDVTFNNLEINYMVFVNPDNSIAFIKGYETDSDTQLVPSDELKKAIEDVSKKIFTDNLNGSGFFTLDDKIYILVSRPILKSNKDGPTVGTLIMVREFDATLKNEIQNLSQTDFDLLKYANLTDELSKPEIASLLDRGFLVNPNFAGFSSYYLIEAVDHQPLLVIRIHSNADALHTANDSITRATNIEIIIMIFSLILGFIFIEFLTVRPLKFLTAEIEKIRTRKFTSQRIEIRASPEFSALGEKINDMLETLDTYDKKVIEVNQKLESKAKELEENSLEMERLNKHMVGRELRMAELKEQLEDLQFKLNEKEENV